MPNYPLDWKPLIGYAMWQLQNGAPVDVVTALMRQREIFGGFSSLDLDGALAIAIDNEAARHAWDTGPSTITLAQTLGGEIAGETEIGLRVVFTLRLRDGTLTTASITVNAPKGMRISEAISRAIADVNSGDAGLGANSVGLDAVVPDSEYLGAIFGGGFDSPSVDLMP